MSRKILVTSALPYANGPLHIGHLRSTYLPADVFIRYCRLRGYDAIYCCATDEHGAPIEINAAKNGKTPQEFVQIYRKKHSEDFSRFGMSFDEFYYTHSPESEQFASEFFLKNKEAGNIYSKSVTLTFCPKCDRFLPDRYVKGECPHCGASDQYGDQCEKCGKVYSPADLKKPFCVVCKTPPVKKDTVHYFFKLSAFSSFLSQWFDSNKKLPSDVTNYLKKWIEEGLQDWDITRDGPYFGFKIPGEQDKYFYVWWDAPIGYVASSKHYCDTHNRSFNEFWKDSDAERVHFIGKDIIYHHFLFWPAMLKGAGYDIPSRIPSRGYLNLEQEKMSKSRGKFLLISDFLDHYPADYLRYYLTAVTPNDTSDGNFSWKEFQAKVNNELVNVLGNFCFRVLSFLQSKYGGNVPEPTGYSEDDEKFQQRLDSLGGELSSSLEEVEIKTAQEKLMAFAADCNKYFNDRAPWHLLKNNDKSADAVLFLSAKAVFAIALYGQPFLPFTSKTLLEQLALPGASLKWGDLSALKPGASLPKPTPLYVKIEDEQIARELGEEAVEKK